MRQLQRLNGEQTDNNRHLSGFDGYHRYPCIELPTNVTVMAEFAEEANGSRGALLGGSEVEA